MQKKVIIMLLLALQTMPSIASVQAKFSLVAKTPTSISVPANRQAYIQYEVTNNTSVTRTLSMVPIAGITQVTNESAYCTNPFTLTSHKSCKLTLHVDGANINRTITGGPVERAHKI